MVCSCGKTFKRFLWHKLRDGSPIYGYECRNRHDNCSKEFRELNGVETEGYCNQPGICQWKLDLMLENIVMNMFEDPKMTVNKLLWTITTNSEAEENKGKKIERIEFLGNEVAKAEARRESLEMKWLDGKIADSDHDRLCSTISKSIDTYKAELDSLQKEISKESESTSAGLEKRLANIREMESVLLNNSNLTTLKLDDEFINTFVARIVPNGRCFKWYLNIGSGRGWSIFNQAAYDLYDYWTIGYDTALKYRKARSQYLRKNQWEDLKVEVYIRTE